MKSYFCYPLTYFTILFCVCSLGTSLAQSGTLTVHISNIESTKGTIRIAVFDKAEGFMEKGQELLGKEVSLKNKKECVVQFEELPFGTYALAVFHDVNNNGKLNKSILGIPTEPYAFSNNVKSR